MLTPLIMLGLLVLPYAILRGLPATRETHGRAALGGCLGLTAVFCFTGLGHFARTAEMAQMIPPVVPYRIPMIYASGAVELLAAGLVLLPTTRRTTGWFLIAMLIGLLPFNVYAAIHRIPFGGHEWGLAYLLVRVPLQLVLMAWCYWFAIRRG